MLKKHKTEGNTQKSTARSPEDTYYMSCSHATNLDYKKYTGAIMLVESAGHTDGKANSDFSRCYLSLPKYVHSANWQKQSMYETICYDIFIHLKYTRVVHKGQNR